MTTSRNIIVQGLLISVLLAFVVYVVLLRGVPFSSTPDSSSLPTDEGRLSSAAQEAIRASYLDQSLKPVSVGAIPYWDQEAAVTSFTQHAHQLQFISVFWYALRADGSIAKYPYAVEDTNLIETAHARGLKVLALIANLPTEEEGEGSWDAKRVGQVINEPAARAKHIADLVELSERMNFDGINIDYEALEAEQREAFTAFVAELALALHERGKILGVALMPKVGEDDPEYQNGSEAQDWAKLAEAADHLYIMTYDEHGESTEPGPIASLPWLEAVLNYGRQLIPAQKLFVGVPWYGYDWGGARKARGLTFQDVQQLQGLVRPFLAWDAAAGSHFFAYRDQAGREHEVWYEDRDSLQAKLTLLRRLGVVNLAFWHLGSEDPTVWQYLP